MVLLIVLGVDGALLWNTLHGDPRRLLTLDGGFLALLLAGALWLGSRWFFAILPKKLKAARGER